MTKLSKLKELLSLAEVDFKVLEDATEEQIRRLVVPSLVVLKKEIIANKKIAAVS